MFPPRCSQPPCRNMETNMVMTFGSSAPRLRSFAVLRCSALRATQLRRLRMTAALPLEKLIQMFVRLAHAFALRLQFRECAAVDAADARHVALAQSVEHLAQRFGFGR